LPGVKATVLWAWWCVPRWRHVGLATRVVLCPYHPNYFGLDYYYFVETVLTRYTVRGFNGAHRVPHRGGVSGMWCSSQ